MGRHHKLLCKQVQKHCARRGRQFLSLGSAQAFEPFRWMHLKRLRFGCCLGAFAMKSNC